VEERPQGAAPIAFHVARVSENGKDVSRTLWAGAHAMPGAAAPSGVRRTIQWYDWRRLLSTKSAALMVAYRHAGVIRVASDTPGLW
jgi:hypothetical protein